MLKVSVRSAALAAGLASLCLLAAAQEGEAATPVLKDCTVTSVSINDTSFTGSENQTYSGSINAGDQVSVGGATSTTTTSGSGCALDPNGVETLNSNDGTLNSWQWNVAACNGGDTSTATNLGDLFVTNPVTVDTTGLGGSQISFWNHFQPNSGPGNIYHQSFSPCVTATVHVVTCITDYVVRLDDLQASGPGVVIAGDKKSNTWQYTMTVQNCTPDTLTNVKVQGGTAGWVALVGTPTADTGSVSVSQKNKAAVVTWTLSSLAPNEQHTLTVTVNGTDPNNPGTYNISGAWSAAYSDLSPQNLSSDPDCLNPATGTYSTSCKSTYTDEVTIVAN